MILIHRSTKNKQWYFTVHAANGRCLVTSELYTSQRGCWGGIQALRQAFAHPNAWADVRDCSGQFTHTSIPKHHRRS